MSSDPMGEIDRLGRETADADELNDAVRWELECLWFDLDHQRRNAHGGVWSGACEHIVSRIMLLTLATGTVTPWGSIPAQLLVNGWYERIHAAIGVQAPFNRFEVQSLLDRIHADMPAG